MSEQRPVPNSSIVTYLLPHSMEQSRSWEANTFSASQEIPLVLWNPKVHYRSHKCPPPALSWASSNQSIPPQSHFLKIHLNILIPSMPGSSKWSLSFGFPHQNPVYISPLPHTPYMPRSAKSLPLLVPNLNPINPAYCLSSYFTNIHFNIIPNIDLSLAREFFASGFPRNPLRTSVPCASSVQPIPFPSLIPSNISRGIPTMKHIITQSSTA